MPARYIQAIYKQYHIFSESQEAQQAAASEEMMEELEDGGMGIPVSGGSSNKPKNNVVNMETVREQQLRKIRENIAAAQSEDPDEIYRFNMYQRNNGNKPPSDNPS